MLSVPTPTLVTLAISAFFIGIITFNTKENAFVQGVLLLVFTSGFLFLGGISWYLLNRLLN